MDALTEAMLEEERRRQMTHAEPPPAPPITPSMVADWLSSRADATMQGFRGADESPRRDNEPMADYLRRKVPPVAVDLAMMGTFGGPSSKTADLTRLALAERLAGEGADATRIHTDTGWFRGPDSKWRYEIDDSGSKLTPRATQQLDRFSAASGELADVLDHPELFAAYPHLRKASTLVQRAEDGPEGMYGADGSIWAAGDQPALRSALAHEAQHGIQAAEGFAFGGNPAALKADTPDAAYEMYRRLAGEVEARNVQSRLDMSPAERQATPPWLTQDVPTDQQILTARGPGTSAGMIDTGKVGPFGPILEREPGDHWDDLVKALMERQTGEVRGALSHPEIGDIDLPWGYAGTGKNDGYGLSKLLQFHPEVVGSLPEIIPSLGVKSRSANRVQLESPDHRAAVRLSWDDEAKKWLLSAFRKDKAAPR